MTIMILGAFFTIFNQTTMTVALPTIMDVFSIDASTGQWLTTGYMLVNGVLIPVTGFLMQRYTNRQLFLSAMVIFLVGTIVSALAPNFPVLLTGRLIQAASTGIIMPLLMNVVLKLYPPEKRGTAMGTVGLAIIFAPAIGPTLTGYVLDVFPWQTLFYGMIPFILIIIVCGFIFLRNVSETIESKMDIISLILSTIGFGALLYGFSEAGSEGWGSLEVIATLTVGVVAVGLFSWRQLVTERPFLDLRAFRYNMFTLTTLINCVITMVMYADMILLPLYLQNARGFTALEAGFLMLPGALLMGLLSPAVGRLFDRFGAKWLSVIGITIILVTTYAFTDLSDSTSYMHLILMYAGRRIGMALFLMPLQTAGLNQLPSSLHSHGTAISNTARQVAGAIGTSLLVTIMTSRTKDHLQDIMMEGTGASKAHMIMEASIGGINDTYFAIMIIGAVSLVLSFFIKKIEQAPEETLMSRSS
ncbi:MULTISPECIES: DHA2 family efflux MFS transporter permease subunit [Rossellomorea]|uniref:DHA2 family efflux MFS transporter permease subunit n=1 Tax=Rossellomorea TaxID=2837508 RepID=UPI001CCE4C37|nr:MULTISPECIES: DHA2 family efflux MFS transporter permease subunit [Rossellomorea]MCA0149510.1 DHA2 family efflux MFS transporter permease subunit [Rossellomorea vietnamensis]WGG47916.1 DHA2 family efflux MFS transporter permease subunit [Rossellomorea sp. DA94]